ncbi:MAG: hypothetical protein QGF00_16710 [Planctomycetota bacterium]|nr:hypothetical protein [Planctomycetota bacterium]MDP7251250.1 hypothetical protein [Planctomycetota bacterium]
MGQPSRLSRRQAGRLSHERLPRWPVPCGLARPLHPPRPFWEKQSFTVFQKHGEGEFSDERLEAIIADNPSNSDAEQREKEEILRKLREGEIDPGQYAFKYDLRREVQ